MVLFLVDDYGYGDIGYEGNEKVTTPNIDRLAGESVRLKNFYQSAAACAPTRAALLTGRDFFRVGVWGVHWGRDFINRDESTLGNLLQSAGYKTGVFGKWHSGKTGAYSGWGRGFDTSVHTQLYEYFDSMVLTDNRVVEVAGPMTDVVGDRAVAFIEENRHQPFFCYVPFQAIHEPFNAPEEIFQKYKSLGHSDHVARLYGMIEVLDTNVGKVLGALDQYGLEKDTLVLFMVDDGSSPGFDLTYQTRRMNDEEREERRGAWAKRLRGTKANSYEGGQISPCYVRWPGTIEGDRDLDILSGVLDIYPTLAELCGASLGADQKPLDGRSLAPALLGESESWENRIYIDATNLYLLNKPEGVDPRVRWITARYQNFKYLREDPFLWGDTGPVRHKLYDLESDPTESNDIAAKHPGITKKLRKEVESWYQDIIETEGTFDEAVYPVGDWSEYATPINLDSAEAILGGAQRDSGSGFSFGNWTAQGDGLAYKLDVLEAGQYVVDLFYDAIREELGSTFSVGVADNRVTGEIGKMGSSSIGPINLPAGELLFDLQLESLGAGEKAMEWMRFMSIRRVADGHDPVMKGFAISLNSQSGASQKAAPSSATLDFAIKKGAPWLKAKAGELISVKTMFENPAGLESWRCYLDFDQVCQSTDSESVQVIRAPQSGYATLNVVARHHSGNEVSARVKIVVE